MRKTLTIGLVLLCNFIGTNLYAQDWEQLGPYGGGWIKSLWGTSQVMYAGTEGHGVYRTTNGGTSWHSGNLGDLPPDCSLFCLWGVGSTVYAGTNLGVYKTINNGITWQDVNQGDLQNTYQISSLWGSGQTLYAGTGSAGFLGHGVYKTTNGGASWQQVNTGDMNSEYSVISLCGAGDAVYAGTSDDGVLRSTDSGSSWNAVNTGSMQDYFRISALWSNGSEVFAAANDGIYKTANSGLSWSLVGAGIIAKSLTGSGTTLYAAASFGAYKSVDGGTNWYAVNNGFPSSDRDVYAIWGDAAIVYAGVRDHGVFKTTDGGGNWNSINSGMPLMHAVCSLTDGNVVYVGTVKRFTGGGSLYKSTNYGSNWVEINTGELSHDYSVTALWGNEPIIYAGTIGNGVHKTINGGVTWSNVNTDEMHNDYSILSMWGEGNTLYAGALHPGGILKTTNGGINWFTVNNSEMSNYQVGCLWGESETVYAGTNSGMYKTENGGASWYSLNSGEMSDSYTITALWGNETTIYAAADHARMYISRDQGETWVQANSGLPENDAIQSISGSGTTIYACGKGLYKTTDQGQIWQTVQSEFDGLTLTQSDSYLYIGTNENSMFRHEIAIPSSPSELNIIDLGSDHVDLTWIGNSENIDGFQIERRIGPTGSFESIATVEVDSFYYQDVNLNPITFYCYRVRSYNGMITSHYSNEACAMTANAIPFIPTDLIADPISTDRIQLTWSDNSNNEEGFLIQRRVDPDSQFVDLTTILESSFIDSGLNYHTTYCYRVSAFNLLGTSYFSDENCGTTYNTIPAAPTVLVLEVIGSAQLQLSWIDNADNEEGFRIERRTGDNPEFVQIAEIMSTTFIDLNLQGDSLYCYRVKAFNEVGDSDYSETICAEAVGIENGETLPTSVAMWQNYPNPFNPHTTIRYALPNSQSVSLKIYDLTGQLMRTLISGTRNPGYHIVIWDGKNNQGQDASSGTYFYRLETLEKIETKQMVLLR
ncbi:MAG: hypothetical protein B6244_00710 [Candidatus Cloacimonetes bacterium 4572_55]|nr:MAG: hypothetical protein B6244_00710 [Candidatus Cloacimonetes bacterium 4572_55]